jgi:hypothetical protein
VVFLNPALDFDVIQEKQLMTYLTTQKSPWRHRLNRRIHFEKTVTFQSAGTIKLFPPRGAPASQIVHPLDPMAETQLRLKPALLSLSGMISENFNQEKMPGLIYLLCHIMLRRCRMRQRIALRLAGTH